MARPFFVERFSIHASAKEATTCNIMRQFIYFIFNPRLREGGDLNQKRMCEEITDFQSTPPRRRRRQLIQVLRYISFFNPRLREGGDAGEYFTPKDGCFSIHASAKEATFIMPVTMFLPSFSIHASAKEATTFVPYQNIYNIFSIHASAKEATATYCNTPAIMCISSLNNFFVHHF